MKHLRHLNYVLKHRYYVFIECCKLGIIWQGITHDLSKFSRAEWKAYVEKFYGAPLGESLEDAVQSTKREAAFHLAWAHHVRYNPHHWDHWMVRGEPRYIPNHYIKELLAHWRGLSRASGKKTLKDWYAENMAKIKLTPDSRKYLHSLMRADELDVVTAQSVEHAE